MRIVGLDLAGSPKRRTGYCLLASGRVETRILYADTDILRALYEDKPEIVAIDAPLSLPFGRCCLLEECSCRGKAHLRVCDKTLLSMKIHFFPITLGPMRLLTTRGMNLAESLAKGEFAQLRSTRARHRTFGGFHANKRCRGAKGEGLRGWACGSIS